MKEEGLITGVSSKALEGQKPKISLFLDGVGRGYK